MTLQQNVVGTSPKIPASKGVYNKILDNVARVSVKGSKIIVKFYRHKMEDKVAPLFTNLSEKLKDKNIDPRIPWLNNRILEFEFK